MTHQPQPFPFHRLRLELQEAILLLHLNDILTAALHAANIYGARNHNSTIDFPAAFTRSLNPDATTARYALLEVGRRYRRKVDNVVEAFRTEGRLMQRVLLKHRQAAEGKRHGGTSGKAEKWALPDWARCGRCALIEGVVLKRVKVWLARMGEREA